MTVVVVVQYLAEFLKYLKAQFYTSDRPQHIQFLCDYRVGALFDYYGIYVSFLNHLVHGVVKYISLNRETHVLL